VGFNLTPLIVKRTLTLDNLQGRTLGVDANNLLYQFLALIRSKDGSPFSDSQGRITSHIVGLIMRTSRLMADYGIRPIFVFDGKPSQLKSATITERQKVREKARQEWREAVGRGDYETAWSKAVRMNSLTHEMQNDAKLVLDFLGIPHVQAPQEGEAQAAYMAIRGDVWAVNSRDYDSLLFGTPRLVRYVTISGQEYLPSKGISRPLIPELIELEKLLLALKLTREQLVDLAILVGTDFNRGIRGVGPRTALKLLLANGILERLPKKYAEELPVNIDELRKAFMNPPVTADYDLEFKQLNEDGLINFLCDERGFGREKISLVVNRMKRFYSSERSKLSPWF
jgi:flap endonuclease-1